MAKRDNKGRFAKGNKGKPKGAVSKEKRAAAEAIKAIVEDRAERLLEVVDNLDDDTFLKTWIQLVEFVEPKLARTELTGKDGKDLNVNVLDGYNDTP